MMSQRHATRDMRRERGQSMAEFVIISVALMTFLFVVIRPAINVKAQALMEEAKRQMDRAAADPSATADAIVPKI